MRVKARNHLYILKQKPVQIHCYHCAHKIKTGELTYSKRLGKRYCAECAFNLGFIKGIQYEEVITN